MAYKEKTCPTCNTLHNKRGPYCSRSCGNHRVHSKKHKELLAIKQSAHMNSNAAIEQKNHVTEIITLERKKLANKADADLQEMTLDDVYVPPITYNTDANQFVADGDLWTED